MGGRAGVGLMNLGWCIGRGGPIRPAGAIACVLGIRVWAWTRKFGKKIGEGQAGGRSGQVGGCLGLAAAGTEAGIHVEFELFTQAVGEVVLTEGFEQEQQGFKGGETIGAVLGAQGVTAGAGHGQANASAPALHVG